MQLILTGISQETSLSDGETSIDLVFNRGEVRVPTSPEGAESLLMYMAGIQQEEAAKESVADLGVSVFGGEAEDNPNLQTKEAYEAQQEHEAWEREQANLAAQAMENDSPPEYMEDEQEINDGVGSI